LVKVRGFKIAAARKMITVNRDCADKSSDVLNTLIAVRDDLKVLKKELDGLV
jgi:transcriptional regulator, MerR family